MLCQLVCVDRRYQRMNCFNIRELQGILKRKFFTDLVNSTDNHKAVESTIINMRHKNNMSNILLYDQSLLYNFDLTTTSKQKTFAFTTTNNYTYSTFTGFITRPYYSGNVIYLPNYSIFTNLLKDFINFLGIPTITSLLTFPSSLFFLKTSLSNNLQNPFTTNLFFGKTQALFTTGGVTPKINNYSSSLINYNPVNLSSSFSENSSS